MYNDLGSGSNVDLCVITTDGVDYLRNYEFLQAKTYTRQFPVTYPKGTAREWLVAERCPAAGRLNCRACALQLSRLRSARQASAYSCPPQAAATRTLCFPCLASPHPPPS